MAASVASDPPREWPVVTRFFRSGCRNNCCLITDIICIAIEFHLQERKTAPLGIGPQAEHTRRGIRYVPAHRLPTLDGNPCRKLKDNSLGASTPGVISGTRTIAESTRMSMMDALSFREIFSPSMFISREPWNRPSTESKHQFFLVAVASDEALDIWNGVGYLGYH